MGRVTAVGKVERGGEIARQGPREVYVLRISRAGGHRRRHAQSAQAGGREEGLRALPQCPQRGGEAAWILPSSTRRELGGERGGQRAQPREQRVLLPAREERLQAFPLEELRELLVLGGTPGAGGGVRDPRRRALEVEPVDLRGNTRRQSQRDPPALRIAGEQPRPRQRPQQRLQRFERRFPPARARRRRALSMAGQIGAGRGQIGAERIGQVIEPAPVPCEPVQPEERDGPRAPAARAQLHGSDSSAANTRPCASRWAATLPRRSVRTSMRCSPPPSEPASAVRSSEEVAGRCSRAEASAAACARSRPCGVANNSSKRSVSPCKGRKWKIPPPSLFATTTARFAPARRAATRPPRSCSSARSPQRSAVGRPLPSAAPAAVETIPSM